MPYISDDELLDFQVQIDQAKEDKKDTDYTFSKAIKDEEENTRKFKIATIILGIIAALGVAGTIYFMNFNTPTNMISKGKANKEQEILKTKIADLEETIKNASIDQEINTSESGASVNDQIIYAVQIGAFKEKDLSLYSDKFMNFREIKAGNLNKYALGNFASLEEAKGFRRALVSLGFKSAFIASYLDGERQQIEEAW